MLTACVTRPQNFGFPCMSARRILFSGNNETFEGNAFLVRMFGKVDYAKKAGFLAVPLEIYLR